MKLLLSILIVSLLSGCALSPYYHKRWMALEKIDVMNCEGCEVMLHKEFNRYRPMLSPNRPIGVYIYE